MATSHGCRWFEGIMRCDSGSIYPENLWKESFSSFHRAGITWEALAVTKRHIGKDSNFHRELENYLQLGEKCKDMYLRAVYSKCYAALSINHGCGKSCSGVYALRTTGAPSEYSSIFVRRLDSTFHLQTTQFISHTSASFTYTDNKHRGLYSIISFLLFFQFERHVRCHVTTVSSPPEP